MNLIINYFQKVTTLNLRVMFSMLIYILHLGCFEVYFLFFIALHIIICHLPPFRVFIVLSFIGIFIRISMHLEKLSETVIRIPLTSICSPLRCSRTSPTSWQSTQTLPSRTAPEEWLDEFSTFSIYQVFPKIIELWGLNIQTDVESKKTSRNWPPDDHTIVSASLRTARHLHPRSGSSYNWDGERYVRRKQQWWV